MSGHVTTDLPLTYRATCDLEKGSVLASRGKKYYILNTELQRVLGHCAEGIGMSDLSSPATSAVCWRWERLTSPSTACFPEQLQHHPAVGWGSPSCRNNSSDDHAAGLMPHGSGLHASTSDTRHMPRSV